MVIVKAIYNLCLLKRSLIKSLIRESFSLKKKKEEIYYQIYKNVSSPFCYLSIKYDGKQESEELIV